MLDEIIIQNPWWVEKKINKNKLGTLKRIDFENLKKDITSKKITCLVGPRRAGKTTLMYDLANHLITNGCDPKRIFFTSLDNPKIRMLLEKEFDDLLKEYTTEILKEPIDKLTKTIYIVLDEIHKLNDWGNIIKYWQDLGLKLKFVVSGSSSLRILKGGGESLLGRITFHTILPFSFSEYYGEKIKLNIHNIKKPPITLEKEKIIIKLDEYIIKGGFPEIINKTREEAKNILRDYKTLTITREILDLKEIKESRILNDLTDLLADSMSDRINYSSFAKTLNIKTDTVKKYMSYLEEAFIIYTAYTYSEKQVISTRKEKKLLFFDHGLRNSLILKEITELEKTKIIENIVFMHIYRMNKQELFPKLFYWLDYNRYEVDVVTNMNNKLTPIEVKYTNKIDKKDIIGLLNFCKKYNTQGFVITKDLMKQEENITYIPAWLFLLSV